VSSGTKEARSFVRTANGVCGCGMRAQLKGETVGMSGIGGSCVDRVRWDSGNRGRGSGKRGVRGISPSS
jgi:hypothetical protein